MRYCRFISSENGGENSFEPLPSQHSCSYKVRFEDIGHSIRCECIVTDVFGRSSEPAYAETASILPGFYPLINETLLEIYHLFKDKVHWLVASYAGVSILLSIVNAFTFCLLDMNFWLIFPLALEFSSFSEVTVIYYFSAI